MKELMWNSFFSIISLCFIWCKYLRSRVCFWLYRIAVFMGIILCSGVALVWTFNTRGVSNFITKEANIPINLVSFFNDVSFLFCRFLKSGVTNVLKSLFLWRSKKVRVICLKQGKNFAAHKTLVWSTYAGRTATATNFFYKRVIYELGSHLNRIRFI